MKLLDILIEMPVMVPQDKYPFVDQTERFLQHLSTKLPPHAKEVYRVGNFRLIEANKEHLYLFDGDEAVGSMTLTGPVDIDVDVPAWQVTNVYIKPEYRNRKLGLLMYKYIIHKRQEAFASGAAMTPSSRRIYTSLFRDPSVDVYALVDGKRTSLVVGQDGVTTADPEADDDAVFVARSK